MMIRGLLIWLCCCCGLSAAAQRPFSKEYWLNEAGASQQVAALQQDCRGYIWLGTEDGLYRFNGRSVIPAGAPLKRITALAQGPGDSLYAGTADGAVCILKGDSIMRMNWQGATPASSINTLLWHQGVLWAGTEAGGIYAFANGFCYQISTGNGLSDNYVYALAFTPDNSLLAATDRGINVITQGTLGQPHITVFYTGNSLLPDNIIRVVKAARPGSRIFWIGTQDGGLAVMNVAGNSAAISPLPAKWTYGQINDILPTSDTQVWVATEEGYLLDCSYANGQLSLRPCFFAGRKFKKLIHDGAGNIWAGTADGLMMLTGNQFSFLRVAKNYQLKALTALTCDAQGALWYALGKALYRLKPGETNIPEHITTAEAPIATLFADAGSRIWMGTLGAGIWCYADGTLRPVRNQTALSDGNILNINGRRDTLWVSSLNGVEELRIRADAAAAPQVIAHHGKHTGIGSDYVYQIFPDSKGRIWMATDGAGIVMWDGARYRHWEKSAGFPGKVVYSITEDAAGRIWAATLGEGIFVYDGKAWSAIGSREGLHDKNIATLAANATGQVMVVHAKGFDVWYPGSHAFRYFNRRLGMDIDSTSSNLNTFARDAAGNVWVPFEHGFIRFANQEASYAIAPAVNIVRISLFGKEIAHGQHEFDPGENNITIRFDGINYTGADKLYYRYMLEGYDAGWISTLDETVSFPRLPAGKYKFRVQASLSPRFENAAEDQYQFHIAMPLWKRPWAIAVMILLLGSAVYTYVRIRERALRRLAILQRERMAAEYEQLKSQVNPHFLFNSLNTLVHLIEESPDRAVHYTIELSDLYRSMLAYRDKDLIPLSEEWALLKKYFYVQQGRFSEGLYLQADIPPQLLSGKKIIPLALQLLVENAIKHNVVSAVSPLVIHITATEESITVRHRLQPKISKERGTGLGLTNIRKRYAQLSRQPLVIAQEEGEFIVTMPLL